METAMKMFFSFLLSLASIPALAGDVSHADGPSQFFYNKSLGGRADLLGANDGCVHTSAFVQAFRAVDESHLGGPTTGTGVFLRLTRQNTCSGVLELDASGGGPVEKFSLEKTAVFVRATVQVFDQVSNTHLSVQVKLVWNGFGERTESNSNVRRIQPDGYREETRFNDVSTISSAVGSVSDGTYEYAEQYQSATIFRTETKFSIFPVD